MMGAMDCRKFLRAGSLALGAGFAGAALPLVERRVAAAATSPAQGKPDYTLKIEPCSLELTPGVEVKTFANNGQVPGPMLRVREGVPVTIDVTNACDHAEIVHKQLSGLRKDVINVMPLETVAVDFVADNPGNTLLHCHQQLHMDFGFMTIIKYTA